MDSVETANSEPGLHCTFSSWSPIDKPTGTLEIKDVENRLVEERSIDEGNRLPSNNVSNLEQLNFEVKNVKVLDPNWSGNLKELVTINDGGSIIESVKKSVEFPLITSTL